MKTTKFETATAKDLQKFLKKSQKRIDKGAIAVEKSQDFLIIFTKRIENILDTLSAWIIAISAAHTKYDNKVTTQTAELAESVLSYSDTIDKLKG